MQGVWVQSLVGELRFCTPLGQSQPKNQNIKQKQYFSKYNKDFKNGPHGKKKELEKEWQRIKCKHSTTLYNIHFVYKGFHRKKDLQGSEGWAQLAYVFFVPSVNDLSPAQPELVTEGNLCVPHPELGASLGAQMVKNLPAMQEKWVRSLGRDNPLEKGMATSSSIPAWRIPWTEKPGGL